MTIRLSLALLPLLSLPALAEASEPLTSVDHVAAIVIGFAGDGAAMVNGADTARITREGPGRFTGTVDEDGTALTFEVVESAPCLFDATYSNAGQVFGLKLDVAKVRRFAFAQEEAAAHYTFFELTLEADDGAIRSVAPGGEVRSAGSRNRIGTSLDLPALEAAVAALQQACPAS